jgi:hypothetical protein
MKSLKRLIIGSLLATALSAVAIVSVMASTVETANADTPRPPLPGQIITRTNEGPRPEGPRPGRPISGTRELTGTARLEAGYKILSRAVANYEDVINRANEQLNRVNTLITNEKAKGKDTSGLETAASNFSKAIANADAKFDSAASIMSTHAGFDASGKVTDEALAKTTLQTAQTAMREGNEILRNAQRDLMKALRDYRRANSTTP